MPTLDQKLTILKRKLKEKGYSDNQIENVFKQDKNMLEKKFDQAVSNQKGKQLAKDLSSAWGKGDENFRLKALPQEPKKSVFDRVENTIDRNGGNAATNYLNKPNNAVEQFTHKLPFLLAAAASGGVLNEATGINPITAANNVRNFISPNSNGPQQQGGDLQQALQGLGNSNGTDDNNSKELMNQGWFSSLPNELKMALLPHLIKSGAQLGGGIANAIYRKNKFGEPYEEALFGKNPEEIKLTPQQEREKRETEEIRSLGRNLWKQGLQPAPTGYENIKNNLSGFGRDISQFIQQNPNAANGLASLLGGGLGTLAGGGSINPLSALASFGGGYGSNHLNQIGKSLYDSGSNGLSNLRNVLSQYIR